ncbi:hypothetical protein [Commensalibacter oyaizuii]|uniref:Uncharacterized protein n=1 Tax=Commensalibacter oyaizuii TaxID=3043873 RepID=A0ABT6Q1Q2_9PROT|nr:hypothetical protein [Commensalibacter sp. TBRC 16381]MDI2091037.1 hypothetical protein [Commensalibacter sp. TBRC 16381]
MSEIETLSLLFDSAWYLETYQDVASANCDPLEHYLAFGYKEGRNPNRFFNTHFYMTAYPDIALCHLNPFIHYILYGASEGRLPRSPSQPPLPFIPREKTSVQSTDEVLQTPIAQEVLIDELPTEMIIDDAQPAKVEATKQAKSVKAKKAIRKPAPHTKASILAQKRKKTAKI